MPLKRILMVHLRIYLTKEKVAGYNDDNIVQCVLKCDRLQNELRIPYLFYILIFSHAPLYLRTQFVFSTLL